MSNQRPAAVSLACKGTHKKCRAAVRAGLPVHITPAYSSDAPSVILPTYHYATEDAARAALADALATAPIVATDEDLAEYRAAGIAHRLPVGWIDPTRR